MDKHVCGIGELDYHNAADGFISCDACGRIYRLGPKGWTANPPVALDARRQDTWKRTKYPRKR